MNAEVGISIQHSSFIIHHFLKNPSPRKTTGKTTAQGKFA